jgi:hypothetical protein
MSPKVFVSYSHDSEPHEARVSAFVQRLRGDGIVVVYDQDVAARGGPDEGWPRWCERQIVETDYVLVCCTALFHQRFEQPARTGIDWDAFSVRQYLYENPGANRKVRALVLEESDRTHVPAPLRPFSVFDATNPSSYGELLGWLKAATTTETGSPSPAAIGWPAAPDDFPRRLADRASEIDHFKSMLSGRSEKRILLVQGPSGSGKTALIQECVAYALHQHVPCSHIDFRGAPPLREVLELFLVDLGQAVLQKASVADTSARAYAVIADLQQLRKPLFLAFDTYEEAPHSGRDWIETQLLPRIGRCPALVVAVAGQIIPEHSARHWAQLAHSTALPPIQNVDDWFDFAQRSYPGANVKREYIEALTLALDGDPGRVSAMISVLMHQLAVQRSAPA